MVTVSMDNWEKKTGYGRCEEEAYLNAYKNFFEGVIEEDDNMSLHLANAFSKLKESLARSKKPPKGKNESFVNSSLLHTSVDKSAQGDRLKTLQNSGEINKSRHNDSGEFADEERRAQSKSRLKTMLGRSYTEADPEKSRNDLNGKSRTPDRALYVHEPHDCLYRGKYKKYKEETHKLSILVDQLQKKLKKYHEENRLLREKLQIEQGGSDLGSGYTGSSKLFSHPDGSVLKDSLNKGNAKNLSYHNTSLGVDPDNEDSRKRLSNSHSFQDLKNKTVEKENKLNKQGREGPSEDKSPARAAKKQSLFPGLHDNLEDLGKSVGETTGGTKDYRKKPHLEEGEPLDLQHEPLKHTPEPLANGSFSSADKDRSGGEKKRLSVPKLKLEVLPNYHGKFNKSINHLFNK